MATLYITEPGSRLEKEYKRLRVVDREGKGLLVTPMSRVSEVVLVGWAGATTPAMLALLDEGIGLTFLTRQGRLRGRLQPPTGKNLPLRQAQYARAAEETFAFRLSRSLVAGKLRNSRTLARRMLRGGVSAPPGQLERLTTSLTTVAHLAPSASRIDPANADNRKSQIQNPKSNLMGLEGQGAKAYFSILRATLKPGLAFGSRSRRPPQDPVNALLSLGYSLLTANLMTALEIVGLDPYCGFFHAEAYGRPALALDLMEEFRPIIVDSVVLTLVNKGMLAEADFEPGPGGAGIYLNRRGRGVFFRQYTRRLNTLVTHPLAGRRLTYQKVFEVQARQVAKLIMGEIDGYEPFLVK